jgi:hypothetical protein
MQRRVSFCAGIDGEASRRCAGSGRPTLYKLVRAGAAPTRHRPHHTTAIYTRRRNAMQIVSCLRRKWTRTDRLRWQNASTRWRCPHGVGSYFTGLPMSREKFLVFLNSTVV